MVAITYDAIFYVLNLLISFSKRLPKWFDKGIGSLPQNADRAVREILSEITLRDDCFHHSSEASLETIGVDSVRMIELVYALEDRFAIEIRDDEVGPENFSSIASLAALVTRKCS